VGGRGYWVWIGGWAELVCWGWARRGLQQGGQDKGFGVGIHEVHWGNKWMGSSNVDDLNKMTS